MDWETLARFCFVAVLGTGGLAWLTREVVKRLLDTVALGYKERLTHENEQAIEHLKSQLAIQGAQSLESLKSALAISAHSAQARNAALVQKQANVIAELYARLVSAHRACTRALDPIESALHPAGSEGRQDCFNLLREFADYFDDHQIYLTRQTAKLVADVLLEFTLASMHGLSRRPSDVETVDAQLRRQELMLQRIPEARALLEADLRRLLGNTE